MKAAEESTEEDVKNKAAAEEEAAKKMANQEEARKRQKEVVKKKAQRHGIPLYTTHSVILHILLSSACSSVEDEEWEACTTFCPAILLLCGLETYFRHTSAMRP